MRRFRYFALAAIGLGACALCWPQKDDAALDPIRVSPATMRVLLENQFVRVIDDVLPPGAAEPMHRHRHGVVVYLTSYTVDVTHPDGQTTTRQVKAGETAWSEATTHATRNPGKAAGHAVRIELKM